MKIKMKRIIYVLCLVLVHITVGCGMQNKEYEEEIIYSSISLDNNHLDDLSFFDERLDKAEVILIGESHGIECNQ